MTDPFKKIEPPADKDAFVRLAYLAALARENEIQFQVVNDWVLPMASLPWTPRTARAIRQMLYHTERCRGVLQSHVAAFPVMDKEDAAAWVDQLHRHHASGPWPSWWSAGVVGIARQIFNLAEVR